jgi:hypothetical protein
MSETKLIYEDIEKVLLSRFPELKERMQSTFGSYYVLEIETPEAYPVFEDVLQELLLELIDNEKDAALVQRIFVFLEEMANSTDSNVTDLLGIAILEPLVFRQESIRRAWPYLGEKTKVLARETAHFGNWEENLPPGESSSGNA